MFQIKIYKKGTITIIEQSGHCYSTGRRIPMRSTIGIVDRSNSYSQSNTNSYSKTKILKPRTLELVHFCGQKDI
ncbi:unnamed protein product, partial [Nesidiocoris tenuis]